MCCFKKHLLLILSPLLISFVGCQDASNWTPLDWELAKSGVSREQYEKDMEKSRAWRYTENVLYVGIPEEKFQELFGYNKTVLDKTN